MRTIAGNAHLETSQEVHWAVSIRWRSQGGLYALNEWTDLSDTAISAARLYDGFQAGTVTHEPLLGFASEVPSTGDIRAEGQFTFEIMTTRELATDPGSTFRDLYSDTYPYQYADVFVSVVLGEGAGRTTVPCWVGKIETVEELEDRVRIVAKDPSRFLMTPLVDRIDTDEFPSVEPGFVGASKPLAIGEMTQFVGVPVVQQYLTSLEVAIDVASTGPMQVGSTTDLADSGDVLVNGERITYAAKTDDSLTGLTRGVGSTVATSHPAGSLVFGATGQTLNGAAVDGPVFMLHGTPLGPGAAITKALAHGNEGRSSYEIPLSDVAEDFQNSTGSLAGLVTGYPQNPDQQQQSAWYAVELDEDATDNQTASWENAAGGESSGEFSETNYALVYNGGRLSLRRSASVEPVGGQRMEAVYLLVEYGNLTTPVPGGNHVPNDGVNTEARWRDSSGTSHVLGTLAPEQEPLPTEVDDPTRTVRTRPLDDQHRHTLSSPVGTAGPQGGVLVVDPGKFGMTDDPPAAVEIKRASAAGAVAATRQDVESVWANKDSETFLLGDYDSGLSRFSLLTDDEALLTSVFRTVGSFLARAYYTDFASFAANFYTLEVTGNDGVAYGTRNQIGNTQVEVSGEVGTTLSAIWPLRAEVAVENDVYTVFGQVKQDQEQFDYFDPLRLSLEPDAASLPAVVLYGTEFSLSGGSTSDAEALEVSNGLRATFDETHSWTTGNCFLSAPNGTAEVKRVTVMWRGAVGATITLRKPNGTIIRTCSNGAIYDLSNDGLTISDLDHAYLKFASGSGATWVRVVVEFEGQLTDTDDETSQRISSLRAFDISEFVDLNDWDSLRQTASNTAKNTPVIVSPDSSGSQNSTVKNNDSLWVVRCSYLIKASPPITQLAQGVSFTFRGAVGYANGGAESRAYGDVMLELLNSSDYLSIGGTEFYTDGWADPDGFHSDLSGPTALANGAVYDAQDTIGLLADMADQCQHVLHWEHGRLKLSPMVTSGWGTAVQTFTDDHLLAPVTRPTRSAESILNKVLVEYNQDYVRRGFRDSITETNSASQVKYGNRRDEAQAMRHNDKNGVDAASVQDAQAQAQADSMLARFADPAKAVNFALPLVGLALQVGDVVALSTAAYTASKVEVVAITYAPGMTQEGGLDRVMIYGLERS